MHVFTNIFRCALQSERGELLIDFLQESPDYDEHHQIVRVKTEVVASVIMSKDSATALIEGLSSAINTTQPEEPPKA